MAWNTPGGSGDKDPWGQRKKAGAGGSDLERFLNDLQRKLSGLFGDGGSGDGFRPAAGMLLIGVVALVLWLASGFYIVRQAERGVILRFGASSEIAPVGLHWHWPYPIEAVEKVDVEEIPAVLIGYRQEADNSRSKVQKESLMLTGDENIIDIEFAVQYRVRDPSAFLFNVRDPRGTITQATESAVREVVGKSTFDFAMTDGREKIAAEARVLLQQMLDRYQTGIEILAVETQEAQQPPEVRAAFDDAVKAREDQRRLRNEAEAYANDIIPRARGAAARLLQQAEGYKASTIARADGDARRFTQIVNEYTKAPGVTRERLYIEAMEQVMSNTTKIFVDQKGGNNILYLPLDKLVPAGRPPLEDASTPPTADVEASTTRESNDRSRDTRRQRSSP